MLAFLRSHPHQAWVRAKSDSTIQETTGHYMTLSHRRGSQKPILLTAASATGLAHGIHVTELPRTFADAVKVTWRLGIRYVWIDCLCIYQDSEQDWRSESAKMGLVYQNSWLNIAAIDSPDCNGGCFSTRNPKLIEPFKVPFRFSSSDYISVTLDWYTEVDTSLLSQRAWVLQERLLSSRQLHFGFSQVYWECRNHNASEILLGGLIENLRYGSSRLKQFAAAINRLAHDFQAQSTSVGTVNMLLRSIEDNPYADIALWDIYAFWKNNVEYYSSRSLTFPRDRLVAISGVAKEMAKAANDQYLAGIWKSKLLFDLLWRVSSRNLESRPRSLRAPAWSWASIDGGVDYILPEYSDKATVEVLEARVSPLSDDACAEILTVISVCDAGFILQHCSL
ncbi:HET-domain-containing protein [Corynespora cassiicola Philippines]|uniref:HET-domain-containing protein n=1 Tax=Corynespora cassiicola Philippines TaxID=1448308 RepID=A0A2T2NJ25_CORCC|nr:HET-domain-containing protein [Corynespora cassiicola Philippines]